MAEISNKALALLVLAALVVVVVATSIQLNKLNEFGPVGFATDQDTGQVNLQINESLDIRVDPNNNAINFGTCTPNASGTIVADSNDSVANTNCTGDAASPQHITIENIGNVDAILNVTGDCSATDWYGGDGSEDFEVAFQDNTASCSGTVNSGYSSLTTAEASACTNLTVSGAINMSARVSIPSDASSSGQCGTDQTNDIQFTGYTFP